MIFRVRIEENLKTPTICMKMTLKNNIECVEASWTKSLGVFLLRYFDFHNQVLFIFSKVILIIITESEGELFETEVSRAEVNS